MRRPGPAGRWRAWVAGTGLVAACCGSAAEAAALRYCDHAASLSASQKDTLLRFAGVVKDTLAASGQRVALVARSGLDLSRFQQRYSHAGVSLLASENAPWSVRQLYYACDEGRPRLFDQGMAGFVLGTEDADIGYVSVLLLPDAEAAALERAALDKRHALALLNATYSANAYAYGLAYQNCNQWVMELLASAWRDVPAEVPASGAAEPLTRAQAQHWLQAQGYVPTPFDVGVLRVLGAFVPWLHSDDHPPQDLADGVYRVSMPASMAQFVQARVPGATRLEFCHRGRQAVIRRGWAPLAEGCAPAPGDTVISLE